MKFHALSLTSFEWLALVFGSFKLNESLSLFTLTSWGSPMCMTVAGKDFYPGLSVEALGCDTDAANPQNNDWLILKS